MLSARVGSCSPLVYPMQAGCTAYWPGRGHRVYRFSSWQKVAAERVSHTRADPILEGIAEALCGNGRFFPGGPYNVQVTRAHAYVLPAPEILPGYSRMPEQGRLQSADVVPEGFWKQS